MTMKPSRIWNRAAANGAHIDWTQFTALEIHSLGEATRSPGCRPLTWAIYGINSSGSADHLHDAESRHEALGRAADVSAACGLPFYVRDDMTAERLSTALLRPIYDLSTAHITQSTAEWLETNAQQAGEYGFLVYLPSEIEKGRYPADLARLMSAALGEADYILFDRDGMTDDRFPIYEW